jgi:conjugative relaxase-like TrwC/TraI family protein
MLRTHWLVSSSAAKAYYRQSDYYASTPGEWLGQGAKLLGLDKFDKHEAFDQLCDNINPQTGELLRPLARDGGRVGMDLTFNSTKSVGIARELAGPDNAGDPRIEQAHREAVAYAMGYVERDMQTRVRAGGKDEDRTTGNMIAYRVTHRDTRISAEDQMPDMSLHDHVFVLNATYDPVEQKWKAAQMGQVKHDAPFYEAIYHNRLAANLRDLGYGVRRKDKAFEISGISDDLVKKFSRRRAYIKAVAEKLGITSAAGMDKLGATTRLGKAKELADDLNGYWVSRLTDKEKQQLGQLEGQKSYKSNATDAVQYAIGHMFERRSVVDEKRLYETALRYGIGSVTPEDVQAEAKRQGLLVKNGEVTTRDVLEEESRIIAFAREGRGTMRPLGMRGGFGYRDLVTSLGVPLRIDGADAYPTATACTSASNPDTATLSREQQAVCRHVWESPDRVIMIRGGAGTGKTRTMRTAIEAIDKPVVVLAPSAEASRGVLRKEGFSDADTVARFLTDQDFRQKAKGGVVWIDEAGLLGIRQLRQVFDAADQLGARVVLQGDKKQHGSVERGATLKVLEQYAGLPVAELKDIRRQRGEYKEAVSALAKGDIVEGFDKLNALGWVQQTPVFNHNKPLVDDYVAGVESGKDMLVVAPTHIEGDEVTADIRTKLKDRGLIGKDEQTVDTLRPLGWTVAEKADPERYSGTEIIQFHRNSGPFRAGDRVTADRLVPQLGRVHAEHFAVYDPGHTGLAAGDKLRITANGKDATGTHKLNNGSIYTVRGVTKEGIALTNGWVLPVTFGHFTHGYVSTSHASQGKTVDRVLIAMGSQSLPAINAEQFYVSASRGRESAKIYTDVAPIVLRDAIQRSDPRKSASELMGRPKPTPKPKWNGRAFAKRVMLAYKRLRDNGIDATRSGVRREYDGRQIAR